MTRLRPTALVLTLLAASACGIVGVCERAPDLGGGARTARTSPGTDVAPAAPGDAAAPWDAGSSGVDGTPPAVVSTALVPGVAAYEKMNVFARPDYESPRIGYARRGVRVLVRGPVDAPDCGDNGQKWFQLDEGGYVCAGRGLLIGEPLSGYLYVPPPPDFAAVVPYRYASVRRDRTAVYRRIPTREDMLDVQNYLFPPPPGADADADTPDAGLADDDEAGTPAAPPPVDDLGDLGLAPLPVEPPPGPPPVPGDSLPPLPVPGADAGVADVAAEDAGMSDADRMLLQRGPRHAMLLRVLMKGFTVAIAGTERVEGRMWYRTLDGGYVRDEDVSAVGIREDRIGVPLSATFTLPVGFVAGRSARVYAANARGEIAATGQLPKFASFAIVEEVTRGDRVFFRTSDERHVSRQRGLVIVEKVDPPRAVGRWDKWIVIDLTNQTLTAYEGPVPVYATLVSTGKEGYDTPRGVFRILGKHVSTPMDDFTLGEPYAIDEVPYVMYFQQNVALHGAFWHRGFGAVRSHGCVNLTPPDAHWLFDWVHPFLPEGWHGVYGTDTDPGTIVWVRKP